MNISAALLRAANRVAWAKTKPCFSSAKDRFGKFNSNCCENCSRQRYLFQPELIQRGDRKTFASLQTFHLHGGHLAASLLPLRRCIRHICWHSPSICHS